MTQSNWYYELLFKKILYLRNTALQTAWYLVLTVKYEQNVLFITNSRIGWVFLFGRIKIVSSSVSLVQLNSQN